MGRFDELRKQAAVKRAAWDEKKMQDIKDAVKNTVNSSAFALTAVNQLGNLEKAKPEDVEAFSERVVNAVVDTVTDYTEKFISILKEDRGFTTDKIEKVVNMLSDMFALAADDTYQAKLKAVALYVHENPNLYSDLIYLK